MDFTDKLISLTRQLYPLGRAFRMPFDGYLERLHVALALSEGRAYNDAISILDNILPDNANFSADDATDWERRLGLISNSLVSLSDRKLAIQRKINFPGIIKARQNYRYLQEQLQSAGFNVFVYENRISDGMGGYVTTNPISLIGSYEEDYIEHGDFQHGGEQHGNVYSDIVVNDLDPKKDEHFSIGLNLRSTFFVGGSPLGTFANIPAVRRTELRQLILKVKPVQTVGYLFLSYV